MVPDLAAIEVPSLICGSFSDHNLHSGGAFEAFRRISSQQKWLYTHGQGKWGAYYSEEALAFQLRFFDHFLKGEENGILDVPTVRLEVRASSTELHVVRGETAWPLPNTSWTPLFFHPDGSIAESSCLSTGTLSFDAAKGRVSFTWTAKKDTEITGPMKVRLHVSLDGADDACLFAGLRKLDVNGEEIFFEGSYGFGRDMVSHGRIRISQRELDEALSEPFRPVHTHRRSQPLDAGEIVPIEIELLPAAVFVRKDESLRLDLQGHWFHIKNPIVASVTAYESSGAGSCKVHVGGDYDSQILLPFQPV